MHRLALPAVLLSALGLRLWGITFGLPAVYRPDEDVLVGRAMGILHGVLDPHFANWPHAFMYVSAGWLGFLRPIFPLMGSAAPYLAVRLLDAVLGTATVGLVYLFGRRAYGESAGLAGAIALGVAFLAVRESHFATVDTPLALCCMLALYLGYRFAEDRRLSRGTLAGICLGLAAGIKYNGALILAGIAAGQGLHPGAKIRAFLRLPGISLIGVVTFLATSPFLLVDFKSSASSLRYVFRHLSTTSQPEIGYLHLPRLALWYGLDPPLFLLSLAGLLYAAIRRKTADVVLVAFILAYYAVIGSGYTVFVRYADPLLPPLALLAGRALAEGSNALVRPALSLALGLVVLAMPALAHDVAYDRLIQQTDTRTQAFDWLASNVPPGDRVAMLYLAGPAHDQALIDRRDYSNGTRSSYVASFLQNQLQKRYSVHELSERDLRAGTVSGLLADRVDYVVYSTTRPDDACGAPLPLQLALDAQARLLITISPTRSGCTAAVFDPIDAYYVPLSGYNGWIFPGPVIRIYRLDNSGGQAASSVDKTHPSVS